MSFNQQDHTTSRARLGTSQLARASAIAPLLPVAPLLLFVIVFSVAAPLRMPAGFGPVLVILGVLPVYLALVSAYFALAFILRALRLLTLPSLLLVSAVASIAIGWQFLRWAAQESASLSEQIESFAFGTGIYLLVSFSTSWLWWRLASGRPTARPLASASR